MNILSLPEEMIMEICSYLDFGTIVNLSSTCCRLNSLCHLAVRRMRVKQKEPDVFCMSLRDCDSPVCSRNCSAEWISRLSYWHASIKFWAQSKIIIEWGPICHKHLRGKKLFLLRRQLGNVMLSSKTLKICEIGVDDSDLPELAYLLGHRHDAEQYVRRLILKNSRFLSTYSGTLTRGLSCSKWDELRFLYIYENFGCFDFPRKRFLLLKQHLSLLISNAPKLVRISINVLGGYFPEDLFKNIDENFVCSSYMVGPNTMWAIYYLKF